MGHPRRRRRRRRSEPAAEPARSDAGGSADSRVREGARRRRRRRRPGRTDSETPRTLEEVVRAAAGPRPTAMTGTADGQRLEEIIGDLQSEWGVPQYPQEYRLTVKVAEDRSPAQSEPPPAGVTRA